MNEQDYWYNRISRDTNHSDLQHEAVISKLHQDYEYGLVSILKPRIAKDGNQWCVLYGENLQEGIAGFGDTPYMAIMDFNKSFITPIKP